MGSRYCPGWLLYEKMQPCRTGTHTTDLPTRAYGFSFLTSINPFHLSLALGCCLFPLYSFNSLKIKKNKTTTINWNQIIMFLTDKRFWFTLGSFKFVVVGKDLVSFSSLSATSWPFKTFKSCNTIFCEEGKKWDFFLSLLLLTHSCFRLQQKGFLLTGA